MTKLGNGTAGAVCGRILTGTGRILRHPGFWFIFVLLVLITIPHYVETLSHPTFLISWINELGLSRHAFERVLYLVPIVFAGLIFGWKGSVAASFAGFACMLPRTIWLTPTPLDSWLETVAVFIVGNVLSFSFVSLRNERDYRNRMEKIQYELRESEERFRRLFANAWDSIIVHEMSGKIIAANKAAVTMTGYTRGELLNMNIQSLIGEESRVSNVNIQGALLRNESVEQPYEQHIIRKDGGEVFLQVTTSLIKDKGKPVAYQHIGRDVTEQKKLDENLRYYVKLATRAQEEERKRIALELHDDTVQSLIVLSRQLDALTTQSDVPDNVKEKIDTLWQQTDNILQGVRRMSQDLRPGVIDRLGLLPAIEWLAANLKTYSGIDTTVKYVGKEHRLPEEVAIILFRVTQEALSNVSRHSEATRADIIVEFEEKLARVTVKDDGKGFNAPNAVGDFAKHGKLGMAGMQERTQLVGGKLTVQSEPGKGTTITVEAPG